MILEKANNIGHLHNEVRWRYEYNYKNALPVAFYLLALGRWQSILVVVVTQRHRENDLLILKVKVKVVNCHAG